MISFEEARLMLDDIAEKLPPEIFEGLNGGIILSPDFMLHPKDKGGAGGRQRLYIMGQYHYAPTSFGRYISLYYGSFEAVYPYIEPAQLYERLKSVLHHELTHHLESLAGDRSLEYKDAEQIGEWEHRNAD